MTTLQEIIDHEDVRRHMFPVVEQGVFLGHAGVAPLPRAAADALTEFAGRAAAIGQEDEEIWGRIAGTRALIARLLGAQPQEIALLGPTALGLNLVANGLTWSEGDEVIYHPDDYPANVYPWIKLRDRGVKAVPMQPERPGVITWELIEPLLTSRTRLVALASCHYLSGYRIDVDRIGRALRERNILFCLDAIQTLGAFALSVEHVDFLSADSHKWMLGPVGAGVFYVKEQHFDRLQPTLLGAWNVYSPEFIAQDRIRYYEGGRRYEPGSLNIPGILAMAASLSLLEDVGPDEVSRRILELRDHLSGALHDRGYKLYLPDGESRVRSGIVTCSTSREPSADIHERLIKQGVRASLRKNRAGEAFIRFSPHCYNTIEELNRTLAIL